MFEKRQRSEHSQPPIFEVDPQTGVKKWKYPMRKIEGRPEDAAFVLEIGPDGQERMYFEGYNLSNLDHVTGTALADEYFRQDSCAVVHSRFYESQGEQGIVRSLISSLVGRVVR